MSLELGCRCPDHGTAEGPDLLRFDERTRTICLTIPDVMRDLVETLCSPACAGRRPGTREGKAARGEVVAAFRAAGLAPVEQEVPGCRGANVIASVPSCS
jgi:hypothetical protein